MSIEVMKVVLEHLERVMSHGSSVQAAKRLLQQAIEQAEKQEPVQEPRARIVK